MVEVPLYLSVLEEDAAKAHFMESSIKQKLSQSESFSLKDFYETLYYKVGSTFAYSFLYFYDKNIQNSEYDRR